METKNVSVIEVGVNRKRYDAVDKGELIKLDDITYFVHEKMKVKSLDEMFGSFTYILVLEPQSVTEAAQRNRDVLAKYRKQKGYLNLTKIFDGD